MKKNVMLFLLFSSFFNLFCQDPWIKNDIEKAYKKPECAFYFETSYFIKILNGFKEVIDKGNYDGTPIRSVQFKSYSGIVKSWTKYKYVEIDTEISKEWFVKLSKLFEIMYRYSRSMDDAKIKNDKKALEEAKKKYEYYVDIYAKMLKAPDKAPRNTRERLEVEKIREYRAYREYLKKQKAEE